MLAHVPASIPGARGRREPLLGIDRGGWLLFAAQGFSGLGTAQAFHLRPTILAGWALATPAPLFYAVAPHWAFTAIGTIFLSASVRNTPAISLYLTLGVSRDRVATVMTRCCPRTRSH